MSKTLIKLAFVLVVGLLTYNFFFGSPEEKETSRRVAGEVRDLGASVFDLLKSEKQKLNEGKYDEALSMLKQAIGLEQKQAAELGPAGEECSAQCAILARAHAQIEQEWQAISTSTAIGEAEKASALEQVRQKILELTRQAESVANELQH